MKNSKGITLLALIITIIVLVILAGIALNTLFGNNGILNNAQYGTEEYKKSAEKEAIAMAFADLKMKLYTDDSITEISAELLEQQLSNVGYNVEVEDGENGNFIITFKDTGDQYEVASNGSIVGEEQTEVANVPLEITGDIECTGGETTILVTVSTNVDSGATYIYHYQLEGGTEQTATSNSSTYTIEGLTVNNNYEVWVEAYNSYNTEHAVSEHVTVRTEYGPYITVPADFAYNGGTITGFDANAESGVATMAKSGDRKVILVIPNEYDNNGTITTVTSLGSSAFNGCTNVISITIPSSVTTIGDFAFRSCTGAKEIIMTDNVTSIGYASFRNCTGIEELVIPKNVSLKCGSNHDRNGSFSQCTSLKKVTIQGGITYSRESYYTDDGPLYGCNQISTIIFEEGITTIPAYIFEGCNQLSSVTIPSTITTIRNYAFNGCSGLTSITYGGTTYTQIEALKSALTSASVSYNANAFSSVSLSGDQ